MKKLVIAILAVLSLTACQQQKIGFVDNGVLVNDYQERLDIEAKLKVKIDAFKSRTDSLRSAFELEITHKDELAISMYKMAEIAEASKIKQENLLTKLNEAVENKNNDLNDLKEEKEELEKIKLENSESELKTESEIIENGTAKINETEEKILSPTTYKSNGGNSAKPKEKDKNNLWSKLKGLWS